MRSFHVRMCGPFIFIERRLALVVATVLLLNLFHTYFIHVTERPC